MTPAGGSGARILHALVPVVVSPLVCGIATWLLVERDAGEAIQRSARKAAHLAVTLYGRLRSARLFGAWVLLAWGAAVAAR